MNFTCKNSVKGNHPHRALKFCLQINIHAGEKFVYKLISTLKKSLRKLVVGNHGATAEQHRVIYNVIVGKEAGAVSFGVDVANQWFRASEDDMKILFPWPVMPSRGSHLF